MKADKAVQTRKVSFLLCLTSSNGLQGFSKSHHLFEPQVLRLIFDQMGERFLISVRPKSVWFEDSTNTGSLLTHKR